MDDDYNYLWDLYDDIAADCVDLMEFLCDHKRYSGHGKKANWQTIIETGVEKREKAKKEVLEKKAVALEKE